MIYQVGEYKDRDTYLRRCMKTNNDMEALVKEILSAARMGGSDFHLERTDLDISQMLAKVCQQFRGRMEDKQMELRMDIQPAYHYQGDRRLMEKVFTNVIGNAVAYSPVGAVITVIQKTRCFPWRIPASTLPRKIWSVSSLPSIGWTNPGTGTEAAAAWGCISLNHPGPPRNHLQQCQYGKWREVYGVFVVMAPYYYSKASDAYLMGWCIRRFIIDYLCVWGG